MASVFNDNIISLKDLCLDLIAEKFEMFHLAFMDSNNETLKWHFDFLLRKYSVDIVSRLSAKRKLKYEYLDYLMNEHLKYVDFDWFTDTLYEDPMLDILCRVSNVMKIFCYRGGDEILENVAKFCPKVVEIEIHIASVTDKGIKCLCKNEENKVPCPELKRLIIDLDEVTDEVLKQLIQDLPSLETLYSSSIPWILYLIHKKDLPGLEKVQSYNLVDLNLQHFGELSLYSEFLKICLTVCPELKRLSCSILDKEQLHFFENTRLKELFMYFSKIEPLINVNNFLKSCGCNLTTLNIDNCMMSICILAVSCPKLEHFYTMNITFLEDDSEAVLQSLISCSFAYFKNDRSLNIAVSSLLSSPKLQKIEFHLRTLPPETKTYILRCCKNHHLKELLFINTIVQMNFIKDVLLCCSSLKNLWLYYSNFHTGEKKELTEFVATLPNKPRIEF